jgi:hypothetical protein
MPFRVSDFVKVGCEFQDDAAYSSGILMAYSGDQTCPIAATSISDAPNRDAWRQEALVSEAPLPAG